MKKIYTNEVISTANSRISCLEKAGITYEVKINASIGKYPYFTFSELCLDKEEDYTRAVRLIAQNR